MTAQAIHGKQLADPKPRLIASKLLREQNFGRAEGKPYVKARKDLSLQEHFTQDLYPHLHSRHESFPDGESIDDLAQRAKGVMEEILLPYVWREEPDSTEEVHVAVVSHGLFIRESIMNLLRTYQTEQGADLSGLYSGLKNTAWTRVAVRRVSQTVLFASVPTNSLKARRGNSSCPNHAHQPAPSPARPGEHYTARLLKFLINLALGQTEGHWKCRV